MSESLSEIVLNALKAAQTVGELPAFEASDACLERPNETAHGDWTSTIALKSARSAHMNPRAIAQAIVNHLENDTSVKKVEIAGPGFINFYLSTGAQNEVFRQVLEQGNDFGKSDVGHGQKVQVEFVSANPVGPLHVGHGRWVALGDSLCRVLEHTNYQVEREYYINDHGSQMDVFGRSLSKRYLQLFQIEKDHNTDLNGTYTILCADRDKFVEDEEDEHPETHPYMDDFNKTLGENAYGGTYIIDIAREFAQEDGDKWVNAPSDKRVVEFRERGYKKMLAIIKHTCEEAHCTFDVWFSERSLYKKDANGTNAVERAFAALDKMGCLYRTDDGALWFRSTKYGDDKDRVLIKSNGDYTYFASDIAYHYNKFQRVDHVIDVWGADHHGYIARVNAVCEALGYSGEFEVLLGQLVNLLRDGIPVRMSKRKGVMITLQELLDEVGPDAVRYTLISKSSNQTIDFDIEAVKRHSNDNPVYYVQYAHARICSILRRACNLSLEEAQKPGMDEVGKRAIGSDYDLSLLTDPAELALSRKVSEFPGLVASCARERAPFKLTHYAEELAAAFHAFYNVCQVLPSPGRPVDSELSRARLAACDAVRHVLALTLHLIGVSAPEHM